ncbi:MAG TPA: glycosyltransferase [Streptosporangiaceae bacterium]|jgi:1,2-diacylglycerol 3-beta-galactosyltransferase
MPGTEQAGGPASTPRPVLFLIADTGGGHRNAARAIGESLELAYPGRFAPVLCDPLGGYGSSRLLRWITGLYGPAVRLAPWLWGVAYYLTNVRPAMWLLGRTLLRPAGRVAAAAATAHRPAAIVSFHPLTGIAAVRSRDQAAPLAPVVTVVTDLAAMHAAWRYADADLIIAPPGTAARYCPAGGSTRHFRAGESAGAWAAAAPPVGRTFGRGPLPAAERAGLRRSLGLADAGLVILLTGGAEGSGGMARRAAAVLRRFADVHVVVVCGRNAALKRRLDRLAARCGGRLTVTGFVGNMGDWLRCCDLVVTKAGPGTIAEATCCGTPLLLTGHIPGQERGNSEIVTEAGAGLRVPGVRQLAAEIGRLRRDRGAIDAMGVASARLGRPDAAEVTARLIAGLIPAGAVTVGAGSSARS